MKKIVLLIAFLFVASGISFGYDSGLALRAKNGVVFSVLVNGKLFNKKPGNDLQLRSYSGKMVLEIVAYDQATNKMDRIVRKIYLARGSEYLFEISFVGNNAVLQIVKKSPVYSKYFKNPRLYNVHPTV